MVQRHAFGWLGLMAGIAGLMQAHSARDVVPNALYGRELDVLAAVVLRRTRLGVATRFIGSNIAATRFSGIDTRRMLVLVYTLSGTMCAIAGIVMLARFNSVRVGHGEACGLITVLACFLGGVDPFGGFGRVLPLAIALVILQVIASGLNQVGASQHLATALWGAFLLAVMMARSVWRSGWPQSLFKR